MGGWKLEVFKMGVYMAFPVVLFYYFNQPEFFQSWMMEKRNQIFPPETLNAKEKLNSTIEYLEKRHEERKAQTNQSP